MKKIVYAFAVSFSLSCTSNTDITKVPEKIPLSNYCGFFYDECSESYYFNSTNNHGNVKTQITREADEKASKKIKIPHYNLCK